MPSPQLENLVAIGKLHREPPARAEFQNLIHSGTTRLEDAAREDLSPESRFDLAYNAAHALALAALRRNGYRSDNRYVVFQVLPHTLGVAEPTWRLLAKCHEQRNQSEYEGILEIDDRLLEDLLHAAQILLDAVRNLPLPAEPETTS